MSSEKRKWILTIIVAVVILALSVAVIFLLLAREGYKNKLEEFGIQGDTAEIGEIAGSELSEGTPAEEEILLDAKPSEFEGDTVQEAATGEEANNQFFQMSVSGTERVASAGVTEPLLGEDEFMIVNLSIENVSGSSRQLIPLGEMFVVSESGSEYTVAFLNEGDLEDNLDGYPVFEAGETKNGALAFEIPSESSNLHFEYRPRNGTEEDILTIQPLE